jgi:hypothetical protein
MNAPAEIIKRPFYGDHLHFYPLSHKYRFKGEWVSGVTGILGRTIPKHALVQWAADQAVDYVRQTLPSRGVFELESVLDEARKAHERTKETAGDQGHIAHEYAENVLAGTGRVVALPEDPKLRNAIAAFEEWRTATSHSAKEIERLVFSEKLFYAGKCDFIGHVKGRPALLDFKTGNGVYKESWLQLAGYETALREEGEYPNNEWDWWIIHLNKKTGACKAYSCLANSDTHNRCMELWPVLVAQDRKYKMIPDLEPRYGGAKA